MYELQRLADQGFSTRSAAPQIRHWTGSVPNARRPASPRISTARKASKIEKSFFGRCPKLVDSFVVVLNGSTVTCQNTRAGMDSRSDSGGRDEALLKSM
jgi:hypothetical protein